MLGGGGPQLEDAFVCRIPCLPFLDRADARLGGDGWRREIGLARAQVARWARLGDSTSLMDGWLP
jgi:hypothetical protein